MKENSRSRNCPRYWISLLSSFLLFSPLQARGQAAQDAPPTEDAGIPPAESDAKTEVSSGETVHFDAKITELQTKIAKQEETIERMSESMRRQFDILTKRLEQYEEDNLELTSGEGESFERAFNVYGFFDLNLYVSELPDSPRKNLVAEDLTFVVNRLNLYFSSHMTQNLSALVEVRFTFLPLGAEKSFKDELITLSPYDRIDTTIMDPFTTERIPLGGLFIERVHLTWKPMDEFGIIAGRFLTPYGIWNVEHGSPVRIPILSPYFMIRELVPAAQTGVQIFGRFFPFDGFYLDYAVTASNNRGPAESVYDVSDNKAFGLRLKGLYEKEDFSASLGGYVYYGTVKDISKRWSDYLPRMRIAIDELHKYEELTGTVDLLLVLFNTRLQVEFIRGMVVYSKADVRRLPILETPTPTGTFQPDYLRTAIYLLLGHEIFFGFGQNYMSIMPYANFEYTQPDDTFAAFNEYNIRGGLNFSPSPFVTLKAEIMHGILPDPMTDVEKAWSYQTYSAQMAVSF